MSERLSIILDPLVHEELMNKLEKELFDYPGSMVRHMSTVQLWSNKFADDIVRHEAFIRMFPHEPVKPLTRKQQLRRKISDLRNRFRDALLVLQGRACIADEDD